MSKLRILLAAALSATAVACASVEEPPKLLQMSVVLTAAQEVPPTPSAASGRGTVTFDRVSRQVGWSIAYSGLSGPLQGAHFHGPATPDQNAGVVVPMSVTDSPLIGAATLTDSMAADLLGGRMYINLHTPAFPNGEIRGQVVGVPPM